jgi:hypothetical protein
VFGDEDDVDAALPEEGGEVRHAQMSVETMSAVNMRNTPNTSHFSFSVAGACEPSVPEPA